MGLAVAIITILFIILSLILYNVRLLTPYYMLASSVILFALWLTILIGTGLGLFGNELDVYGSDYCSYYSLYGTEQVVVANGHPNPVPAMTGTPTTVVLNASEILLARMFWGQLCSAFKTAFAFELIGV